MASLKASDPAMMPRSFRKYQHMTESELTAIHKKARELELTSDQALNYLVAAHAIGRRNEIDAFLRYLADLR